MLRRNIRTSNILRLLCDLGAVDPRSVPAAVGHVVTTGMASPVALRTAVDVHARRGRHGVPAFRDALDEWVIDGKPTDSVLEPAMRSARRRARLPPVEFHRVIRGYEVDFWVIDSPIVLECDGWDTPRAQQGEFERDRVRDGELTAAGYITVRFTYRQITRQPAAQADRIRRWFEPAGRPTLLGADRLGIRDGSAPRDGSRPDWGGAGRVPAYGC